MKLRTFVAASRRPRGRRLEFLPFCKVGQGILACHILGPPGHTPCPTTRFRRTGDVERKKSYAPSFQTLTSIYPCQADRKIRPLLLQCKQKVVREKHLGTKINAIPPRESWEQRRRTTKVETRSGARLQTCRVAIRGDIIFAAPCGMSLQHSQPRRGRCRPSRSGSVNTHESNEIAPVMWGVVTRVRPAPSTQTIENKRTILRHRPRTPRKTEIYHYMRHFATFCDIL